MAALTDRPAPLLTAHELSRHLGVSVQTIYAWRHRGRGPRSIRVGKYLRYRREDVDTWLDEQASTRRAS